MRMRTFYTQTENLVTAAKAGDIQTLTVLLHTATTAEVNLDKVLLIFVYC